MSGKARLMGGYDVDAVLLQALGRLTMPSDVNTAPAAAPDVREGLRRVCRIPARRLGDECAIDPLTASDQLDRIRVTRRDSSSLERHELRGALPLMPPDAADTGDPGAVGHGPVDAHRTQLHGLTAHPRLDAELAQLFD